MAVEKKKFSDLDLNFIPHPDTGDIVPLRDHRAIARSVRNVVLYNFYEKPFKPQFGGNILSQLFENSTPQTRSIIKNQIEYAIKNFEPRVNVIGVSIRDTKDHVDLDKNTLEVTIIFVILGESTPIEVSFFLQRVR